MECQKYIEKNENFLNCTLLCDYMSNFPDYTLPSDILFALIGCFIYHNRCTVFVFVYVVE